MKRFLILLLAFVMIFSVACVIPVDSDTDTDSIADTDTSTVTDKESDKDLSEDSDTDFEENTENDIESDLETDIETDIDTEIESDLESDLDSDTDLDTDSDTDSDIEPEKSALEEYGSFTTLHETVESFDRNKQMNSSKSSYNTGSSLSSSELDSIASKARLIASFPINLVYPNGSKLMAHYLAGTGENYELNVEDFVKDTVAKKNRDNDITEAMRAIEQMCPNGENAVIYRKEENIHHNLTGDWKFSVGSYFTAIKVEDIAMIGDVYTATFTYSIIDYYNWNQNDTNKVAEVISPAELYQLHKDGRAQEFLTYGEITYRLTWVVGADASSAIND